MLDLRACLPLKKKWRKRSKEEAAMTVPVQLGCSDLLALLSSLLSKCTNWFRFHGVWALTEEINLTTVKGNFCG